MVHPCFAFVLTCTISSVIAGVSKKDLLDELAFKQISRSTFDSRIHQKVKPIGFVGDKPIWPRVLDHVESSAELFFDDDNFAYRMNHVGPEHMIRYLDSKDKLDKVLQFIDRALDQA
ncbi:hypothetical protein PENTCL1PPCAC_27499 [Pristionchus entomophagus]|uniref:Uncharacterized protein n=1 Tax=Pristionchus entomophagus TaxID=358040 RepID=A0AAV5UH33_9BILA|nr:hypothetical protein PENTCL1PPCAC_27499 [Pristionchus entomophagus]